MSARETVRPLPTATPLPMAMHTAIPALRRARPGLITCTGARGQVRYAVYPTSGRCHFS